MEVLHEPPIEELNPRTIAMPSEGRWIVANFSSGRLEETGDARYNGETD
jgi:hypothetical protein